VSSILHRLSRPVLTDLARALSAGRLLTPYSTLSLREWVVGPDQGLVCQELERFRLAGMSPAQIGMVFDLLAIERAQQQSDQDRIQMVWTGPDQEGFEARDTGVVARELLRHASRSLLITTFSISRDEATFEPVAAAMNENPDLDVTLVLNIDMSKEKPPLFGKEAICSFAEKFWSTQWPWRPRPKVFFDPRGTQRQQRASQHSKCVVVDLERVFVTSANYTESGQLRNIELGLVVHDAALARRVDVQFRSLISGKHLTRLPDQP